MHCTLCTVVVWNCIPTLHYHVEYYRMDHPAAQYAVYNYREALTNFRTVTLLYCTSVIYTNGSSSAQQAYCTEIALYVISQTSVNTSKPELATVASATDKTSAAGLLSRRHEDFEAVPTSIHCSVSRLASSLAS